MIVHLASDTELPTFIITHFLACCRCAARLANSLWLIARLAASSLRSLLPDSVAPAVGGDCVRCVRLAVCRVPLREPVARRVADDAVCDGCTSVGGWYSMRGPRRVSRDGRRRSLVGGAVSTRNALPPPPAPAPAPHPAPAPVSSDRWWDSIDALRSCAGPRTPALPLEEARGG